MPNTSATLTELVNNLNGVPNFGHGFEDEEEVEEEVVPTVEETPSIDEVKIPEETEEVAANEEDHGTSKRKPKKSHE